MECDNQVSRFTSERSPKMVPEFRAGALEATTLVELPSCMILPLSYYSYLTHALSIEIPLRCGHQLPPEPAAPRAVSNGHQPNRAAFRRISMARQVTYR